MPFLPQQRSTGLSPLLPDPGCANRANWCCRVDPAIQSDKPPGMAAVENAMARLGYDSHSRHPALKIFRRGGRELAWVVSSGRVQIRVPMVVPAERRESVARWTWRDLRICVFRAPNASGDEP